MREFVRAVLILAISVLPLQARAEKAVSLSATEKVRLWEGTSVHSKDVTLETFLPEQGKSGVGVIICPGGSYCWHDYETEGRRVAKWLNDNGIAAFLLKYRVLGKYQFAMFTRLFFPGHQHPDMISDLQRAIQYVRENSARFGIRTLGAMGFSAGGHLVMCAAEFADTDFPALSGISSSQSRRLDFVAPIYPVVTMKPPYVHKRSRRALLGEYRIHSKVLQDSLSLEDHVPANCPPVFLVNCTDDPVVKYQNSVLLDSALTVRGVNHKYIRYENGGHGFGASDTKGSDLARGWKKEFLLWLEEDLKVLEKSQY